MPGDQQFFPTQRVREEGGQSREVSGVATRLTTHQQLAEILEAIWKVHQGDQLNNAPFRVNYLTQCTLLIEPVS